MHNFCAGYIGPDTESNIIFSQILKVYIPVPWNWYRCSLATAGFNICCILSRIFIIPFSCSQTFCHPYVFILLLKMLVNCQMMVSKFEELSLQVVFPDMSHWAWLVQPVWDTDISFVVLSYTLTDQDDFIQLQHCQLTYFTSSLSPGLCS